MIHEISNIVKELEGKPTWSTKELLPKLHSASSKLTEKLKAEDKIINVSSSKKTKVEEIKKYDILYVPLLGIPHYFLVHRIIEDKVYGVNFSSNGKPTHAIHKIERDRILLGSFATNSYLCVEMEEAKNSFIRVYESKKEAEEIFKKVISHYKKIFK